MQEQFTICSKKFATAIQRLELLLNADNQALLDYLALAPATTLQELSLFFTQPPSSVKKRLDLLKTSGLVYSPKRYPQAYTVNQEMRLKIELRAKTLARMVVED